MRALYALIAITAITLLPQPAVSQLTIEIIPLIHGAGLVCETRKQVERFIVLRNLQRSDDEAAVRAVNEEVNVPNACLMAHVRYVPLDTSEFRTHKAIYTIQKINVFGFLLEDDTWNKYRCHCFTFISEAALEEEDA